MLANGRYRRGRWRRGISYRRDIWSRCCRRWCAIGILKGIRGPHGGYALAREGKRISAEDIVRAASHAEEDGDPPLPASPLLSDVVRPALAEAERVFSTALARINIDDIARSAESLR